MIKLALLIAALSASALGQTGEKESETRPPNPRLALVAGLIPGGGQLYNRRWLKAIFFAGAEAYYLSQWETNRNSYRDCVETSGVSCNGDLERRNKFAWWVGIYYVMGMVEAYVDAHLITFPEETVEPAGDIPATQFQELQ
ncbi:MAG: hypothetical protein IIA59_00820 [Candidatus Marinimicrobia bacterium]|nr:hypothetical protein [Candidatus Neomarinimicrobiota bacterium]